MTSAILMSAVTHQFGKRSTPLFEGLDLDVATHESVAVMGESGSGKSTLLSLVLGLFAPTHGQVSVLGTDWAELSSRQRAAHRSAHLGVVFQFGELIDDLTPLENVLLPSVWAGTDPTDARARGEELLERLQVRTGAQSTAVVSGGERQRIAVARALINSPQLVVADEPTGSLDERNAEVMSDLLFDLPASQGCALLVVTHSRAVAERADRVLTLSTAATEGER